MNTIVTLTQREIIEAVQEYAVIHCNMQPPIAGKLRVKECDNGAIDISAEIHEADSCIT
jgi:hypothetical protein